jgi:hypothetical protein
LQAFQQRLPQLEPIRRRRLEDALGPAGEQSSITRSATAKSSGEGGEDAQDA